MSFRNRLALLLMVILICVQAATALLAYAYLRHTIIEQGRRELAAATDAFMRQLTFLSDRVTDAVAVLALDYPLRAAIAQHDHGTELSVLRNHGRRIGAERMMLVGLNGQTEADSSAPDIAGHPFPFPRLLDAAEQDNGTALVTLGDKLYWLVVVPVRAPVPIAFIAAFIPINGPLLDKLERVSSSPHAVTLAVDRPRAGWTIAAHSRGSAVDDLQAFAKSVGATAIVMRHGEEYLTASAPLGVASGSHHVVAILDYPLEETLRAYRGMLTPMLFLFALALIVAAAGTTLIVGRVSRPLEELAATARRIASGDYTRPPRVNQRDEVGHLADALTNMTQSIAEREQALKSAISSAELARAEAVHASEAKSQFLANMSHEFRTPLNAIVGFSEMLQRQVLGPVGVARYLDYAGDIHRSGRRLTALVDGMLDLAEAETNRLVLVHETVSAGALLREAAQMQQTFAVSSGVSLHVVAAIEEWPHMDGDGARLKQAFANLIHNAVKFTPAGGAVHVSGRVSEGRLSICIADTGVGIEPSKIDEVVRPFHRQRAAFDGQHQGAGLGLPFAKMIVELHAGSLSIASTVGEGTSVAIELPARARIVRSAA
ncbi:MAG: ATP-binding protein [Rhizomicrobium sp.]|jgi:signal transduction histidine kinase